MVQVYLDFIAAAHTSGSEFVAVSCDTSLSQERKRSEAERASRQMVQETEDQANAELRRKEARARRWDTHLPPEQYVLTVNMLRGGGGGTKEGR